MMFTFCVLFCFKLLLLIKRSIFVKFSELSILIISHKELSFMPLFFFSSVGFWLFSYCDYLKTTLVIGNLF